MPQRLHLGFWLVFCSSPGWILAFGFGAQPDQPGPVKVVLQDAVSRRPGVVLIGDVATVSGGAAALRQKIAGLDLLACGNSDTIETITRERIRIRLVLAGIPEDQVELAGARASMRNAPPARMDEEWLREAIQAAFERQFGIPAQQWDLRFSSPIPEMTGPGPGPANDVRIEVTPPQILPLGPTTLRIATAQGDQPPRTMNVSVDVGKLRTVAVARQLIERGEPLTADRVEMQTIRISEHARYAGLDELTGRTARVPIRPGQPIRWNDTLDASSQQVLVRPRELVRMVARKGRLQVTLMNAEALDQGRLGDNVRVRNPDSGRIVSGRVVGPGAIEVRL